MSASPFTLTPLAAGTHGDAQVRFNCNECGHVEYFGHMRYTDIAHVLGHDHYHGACPAARATIERHPQLAEHAAEMRRRHLVTVPAQVSFAA